MNNGKRLSLSLQIKKQMVFHSQLNPKQIDDDEEIILN
jgi:hypothetical protein